MKLDLQATPEEVMRAVEALRQYCGDLQLQERDIFGLSLALEECGSNIVNHAYHRDPRRKFKVEISHTRETVTVELRDGGPAFDPTRQASRETESPGDDCPPGGWGIQLARRYVDTISYRRENGENVLRLTKTRAKAAEK